MNGNILETGPLVETCPTPQFFMVVDPRNLQHLHKLWQESKRTMKDTRWGPLLVIDGVITPIKPYMYVTGVINPFLTQPMANRLKLLRITYLVGKIKFKLLFLGSFG